MENLIYFLKRYKFILILGLLLMLIILIFFPKKPQNEEEIIEFIQPQISEVDEVSNVIKVNIKGAIQNPGVYELSDDARVEDAIKSAGGLMENADTSIINLSRKLSDESVIIIYTKEEVKKIKQGNVVIQYIENECNCPEYQNSACIDPDTLINNDSEEKNNTTGKISLNTATIDQLQTLSGIGESKAKSIIEYRNNNGGFKSIEEIKNVKGIGDAIFNKIKDNITV